MTTLENDSKLLVELRMVRYLLEESGSKLFVGAATYEEHCASKALIKLDSLISQKSEELSEFYEQ